MDNRAIELETERILDKMNCIMVEFGVYNGKRGTKIHLTAFKEGGITLDDCAQIHKVLFPRLELLMDDRDVFLEVSSPGLNRKIKSEKEYKIFKGKYASILLEDESEWLKGRIGDTDEGGVKVIADNEETYIPFSGIKKAKLDIGKEIR